MVDNLVITELYVLSSNKTQQIFKIELVFSRTALNIYAHLNILVKNYFKLIGHLNEKRLYNCR